MKTSILCCGLLAVCVRAAAAAQISGTVTDPSGAVVPNAQVIVRDIATGVEIQTTSSAEGRYVADTANGSYLLIVTRDGFTPFSRTLDIATSSDRLDVPVALELGLTSIQLTVTPARAERDQRQIPFRRVLDLNAISGRSRCTSRRCRAKRCSAPIRCRRATPLRRPSA